MAAVSNPNADKATLESAEALNGQLRTPSLSPFSSPILTGDEGDGKEASHFSINEVLSSDGDISPNEQVNGTVGSLPPPLSRPLNDDAPKRRTSSHKIASPTGEVQKLSPAKIFELTSSPESLPVRVAAPVEEDADISEQSPSTADDLGGLNTLSRSKENRRVNTVTNSTHGSVHVPKAQAVLEGKQSNGKTIEPQTAVGVAWTEGKPTRPNHLDRTMSTPPNVRRRSAAKTHNALQQAVNEGKSGRPAPPPLDLKASKAGYDSSSLKPSPNRQDMPSPVPSSLPLPPMSLPLYLQLEVSSGRPSPLYIHRSLNADVPFETDEIKFERLLNFLRLPQQLESVLDYGALTCLDSFLFMFTILPLRFLKAISILIDWALQNLAREVRDIAHFIYFGVPRLWRRRRARSRASSISKKDLAKLREQLNALSDKPAERPSTSRHPSVANGSAPEHQRKSANRGHKRTRSTPSALGSGHKADLLKGFLMIVSCAILLRFDASRMYHSIRGQSAIKLYVIYNVLEVADRLLSAVGQDILECLFSSSVLARDSNGRSLVWRPFWMFCLALFYNVVHATALFYQVITLNVAVNSYSNALLTLLMSNQFVEIKGTVFKKFEKENLFQLTCADIVERFQLWLMLTIIALRNIVEVGNLSISLSSILGTDASTGFTGNATAAPTTATNILPKALTVLPNWAGEVLGPFLIVLGSEMVVDWLKHAYISKFNNTKPDIYGRFLDVIAKDYYIHAFAEQNLTKRLGLPVLPLACLFIRAASQTYHMFLATHMPLPIPSTATAVSVESATSSPNTTAALAHIDKIFRRALGRSTFGGGAGASASALGFGFGWPTVDDVIALATMLAFFLLCYFILLAAKLLLGMALLSFARRRYKGMKERERGVVGTEGRRVGGWGVVEVDDEKRRWIYKEDEKGLEKVRARDEKAKKEAREGKMPDLMGVDRYQMVAKRIW